MRNEEESLFVESGAPHSSPLTPLDLGRLNWRCRRGMLELDLVLKRFLEENYAKLTAQQQLEFDTLLDLPDQELWSLIRGDGTGSSPVVQLLCGCQGCK